MPHSNMQHTVIASIELCLMNVKVQQHQAASFVPQRTHVATLCMVLIQFLGLINNDMQTHYFDDYQETLYCIMDVMVRQASAGHQQTAYCGSIIGALTDGL